MLETSDASAIVEFGRFRVEPRRRELLADGQPIKLGGRAFDLLIAWRGALERNLIQTVPSLPPSDRVELGKFR
jgi:DNA-binding response OmpR family regulator